MNGLNGRKKGDCNSCWEAEDCTRKCRERSNAEMAKLANQRPPDYENLSAREQWEIDKELGILDWDGTC